MGACVLNGIGAGPAETIQPAVIADIFFLHDRGFWNTLYWVFYMGSLMVAPIISGSMALHVGWRSFWWLNTGLTALSIVMVIFMFPETKWHRLHPDEVLKNAAADAKTSPHSGSQEKVPESDKLGGDLKPVETEPNSLSLQATAERDPWLGRGKPSRQQWKLFQPNANPFKSILMDLWIPWYLFIFPIVEFSSFVVSWSCSSFLTINLTQSLNFSLAPYKYDSEIVGFFNFAILIGAAIGLATAGPLSDWISARSTRKNKGIREPEMRLPAMSKLPWLTREFNLDQHKLTSDTVPFVCIMLLGNFVVAFGYQQK